MQKPRLTQRRLLTAVVFVLFVCCFLPVGTAQHLAEVPHWLLSAALAPPGSVVKSISHKLRPGEKHEIGPELTAAALRGRLAKALEYVGQLETQNARLRRENARLKQSKEVINLGSYQPLEARVTSYSGDQGNPVITIDHGSRSGVGKRMTVISGASLVGKVIATGPLTAEVQLITTPGTGLSVRVLPPSVQVPPREIDTWVKYNASLGAFYFDPAKAKRISIGDIAQLADDRWPDHAQGLIVGKVTRIMRHPTNWMNLKRVVIKPMVSLQDLSEVMVLVPKD